MMRDILFRGKRVDNGKWVEGNYSFQIKKIHQPKFVSVQIGSFGEKKHAAKFAAKLMGMSVKEFLSERRKLHG